MMLKKRIDALVMNLNEYSPAWRQPPLGEFLKTLPFFSYFSADEIKALASVATEIDVHKDNWVMKVNKYYNVYLTLRRKDKRRKNCLLLREASEQSLVKALRILSKKRKELEQFYPCTTSSVTQ